MTGQEPQAIKPTPAPDRDINLDDWDKMVAEKFKVPHSLMKSMAAQESGGNVGATSPTGVKGRYQVTQSTAKQYGLDRDDPFQQSVAAAKHLRAQYDSLNHLKSDDERWLGAVGKYYGGNDAVQGDSLSGSSVDGLSNPAEHVKRVAMKWGEMRKGEQQPAQSNGIPAGIAVGHDQNPRPATRPQPTTPLPRTQSKTARPGVFAQNAQNRMGATSQAFDALDYRQPGGAAEITGQNLDAVNRMAPTPSVKGRLFRDAATVQPDQSYGERLALEHRQQAAESGRREAAAENPGVVKRAMSGLGGALNTVPAGLAAIPRRITGGAPGPIESRFAQRADALTAASQPTPETSGTFSAGSLGGLAGTVLSAAAGARLLRPVTPGGVPGSFIQNAVPFGVMASGTGASNEEVLKQAAVGGGVGVASGLAGGAAQRALANRVASGQMGLTAANVASRGAQAASGAVAFPAQSALLGERDPRKLGEQALLGAAMGAAHTPDMSAARQARANSPAAIRSNIDARSAANEAAIRMTDTSGFDSVFGQNAPQQAAAPPVVQPPKSFREVADKAISDAEKATQAGDHLEAALQYDGARQALVRLRRQSAKTATPEELNILDGMVKKANQKSVQSNHQARVAAREQAKAENATTKGLTSEQPVSPQVRQNQQLASNKTVDNVAPVQPSAEQPQGDAGQVPLNRPEPAPIDTQVPRPDSKGTNEPESTFTPDADTQAEIRAAAQEPTNRITEGANPELATESQPGNILKVTPEEQIAEQWSNLQRGLVNRKNALQESEAQLARGSKLVSADAVRQNRKHLDTHQAEMNQFIQEHPEVLGSPAAGQPVETPTQFTEYEGGELQRYSKPLEGQPVEMPAKPSNELPEVTASRARESLPPVERQAALREAVPKGLFGKFSEKAHQGGNLAIVNHPQLRRLLGLGEMPPYHLPDAEINPKTGKPYVNPEWTSEAQTTLNMLAKLGGKERSSQISFTQGTSGVSPETQRRFAGTEWNTGTSKGANVPKIEGRYMPIESGKPTRSEAGELFGAVSRLARSKGERVDPTLRTAFETTTENAKLHQDAYQEFSVDHRTENVRQSLNDAFRLGKLNRAENKALFGSFQNTAREYGLSDNYSENMYKQAVVEARQRAQRPPSQAQGSGTAAEDTSGGIGRVSADRGNGEQKATGTDGMPRDSVPTNKPSRVSKPVPGVTELQTAFRWSEWMKPVLESNVDAKQHLRNSDSRTLRDAYNHAQARKEYFRSEAAQLEKFGDGDPKAAWKAAYEWEEARAIIGAELQRRDSTARQTPQDAREVLASRQNRTASGSGSRTQTPEGVQPKADVKASNQAPMAVKSGDAVTWSDSNKGEQSGKVDVVRSGYATIEKADGTRETVGVQKLRGQKEAVAPEAKKATIAPEVKTNEETKPTTTSASERRIFEPVKTSGRVARGAESTLTVPRSKTHHAIRYEVRELGDIQASHNPFSFEKNPDYRLTNDRDYSSAANRLDVEDASKAGVFDPRLLLTDDPTATNGPPVIYEGGEVLGGNSRTMMLARVYRNHPIEAMKYRQGIEQRAAQYGLDTKQLKRFDQPVLVRVIDSKPENLQKLITDLNVQPGKAMTSTEAATARGKNLAPETMKFLGDKLFAEGPDGTLADALRGQKGIIVLDRLIRDGSIPAGERNKYLTDQGEISAVAKSEIEGMMLGRMFDSADQMKATTPAIKNKLARIAPQLAKLSGSEWDISKLIPNALRAAESSKNQQVDLEMLNRRGSLFGETVQYTPEELAIARYIKELGPRQLENKFTDYVSGFEQSEKGQGLFGDPPKQSEIFDDVFKPAREKQGFSFGPDANEPKGPLMASGLGVFQDKFGKRPIPKDFDLDKWKADARARFPKDMTVKQGNDLIRAGEAVVKAHADGDGRALRKAMADVERLLGPRVQAAANATPRKTRAAKTAEPAEVTDSTFLEKASTGFKAALLSRPVTHLRNIIGNEAFQNIEEVARIPGSIGDTALSLLTGQRALEGVSPVKWAKSQAHMMDVTYTAATKGIEAAKAKLKGPTEGMGRYQDIKEVTFKTKWLDKTIKSVFKTLDAEDKVFFSAAYDRAIREQAKLGAINAARAKTIKRSELKSHEAELLKNPTAEMEFDAMTAADMAVFRNKNVISTAISSARRSLAESSAGRVANFGLDQILPFDKTPTNIVARALDYSPVGMVNAVGRTTIGVTKGTIGAMRSKAGTLPTKREIQTAMSKAMDAPTQRRIAQLIGRSITGSAGLMTLGYYLASQGMMTGFYEDDDPKGEAMKRASGAQPLSIRIAGRWYSVQGVAPIGMLMGMGATLHQELHKKGGNVVGGMARSAYEVVGETPGLKTLHDTGKDIGKIQKDRGNVGDVVGRRVASYIPGVVNDAGQLIPGLRDPNERDPKLPYKSAETPGRKAATEFSREIGAKIPGVRRLLPVKKDATGQPIETEWTDVIDPFRSRPAKGKLPGRGPVKNRFAP